MVKIMNCITLVRMGRELKHSAATEVEPSRISKYVRCPSPIGIYLFSKILCSWTVPIVAVVSSAPYLQRIWVGGEKVI